jgi:hypothetical protein
VGFCFFYLWVRDVTGSAGAATIASLILATYPGAVFFSAGLTEAPFFLLVSITLWLVHKKRLYWAALVCGVATATRPTGAALAVTVTAYAMFVHFKGVPIAPRLAKTALVGLLSVSGGLAYEAFLWQRYNSPTTYLHAQDYWERAEAEAHVQQAIDGGPKRYSLPWWIDRAQRPQAWNRGIALVLLALMVYGLCKPHGIPRILFALPLIIFLMTYVPNNGLRASSIYRYETAGLPVFALVAVWFSRPERRAALLSLLGAQLAVQIYYAVQFSRGVWVG